MGIFRKKKAEGLKKWHLVFFILIIIITASLKLYSYHWPNTNLELKNKTLKVLVADTSKHQVKGLSDRKEWGKYQGMLFIYKDLGQHVMVMRDMNFPLDIVWLKSTSSDRNCFLSRFELRKLMTGIYKSCEAEIIDIAPNLQPEPIDKLTPYFARGESDLVLELPAGWAKENDLKIGDKLEIVD